MNSAGERSSTPLWTLKSTCAEPSDAAPNLALTVICDSTRPRLRDSVATMAALNKPSIPRVCRAVRIDSRPCFGFSDLNRASKTCLDVSGVSVSLDLQVIHSGLGQSIFSLLDRLRFSTNAAMDLHSVASCRGAFVRCFPDANADHRAVTIYNRSLTRFKRLPCSNRSQTRAQTNITSTAFLCIAANSARRSYSSTIERGPPGSSISILSSALRDTQRHRRTVLLIFARPGAIRERCRARRGATLSGVRFDDAKSFCQCVLVNSWSVSRFEGGRRGFTCHDARREFRCKCKNAGRGRVWVLQWLATRRRSAFS